MRVKITELYRVVSFNKFSSEKLVFSFFKSDGTIYWGDDEFGRRFKSIEEIIKEFDRPDCIRAKFVIEPFKQIEII